MEEMEEWEERGTDENKWEEKEVYEELFAVLLILK